MDTHTQANSGIIRVNKGETFQERLFNDKTLSWETRGLLGYLLTKPDGWQVRFTDLLNNGPAREFKLRKMLREAERFGYMNRKRVHNADDGSFDWITEVYESPDLNPIWRKPPDGRAISRKSTDGTISRFPPDIVNPINNTNNKRTKTNKKAAHAASVTSLPRTPGSTSWPTDVKEHAVAFAKCFGRDPYEFERGHWIKSFRQKYLPLAITVAEMQKLYEFAKKDKVTIKSPDSIMYNVDKLRPAEKPKAEVLQVMPDGAKQVRWPDGSIGLVYG